MTTYTVSSGHTSSGITLNPGDTMTVLNGGTAVSTTVNGGFLDDFGKITGTVFNAGRGPSNRPALPAAPPSTARGFRSFRTPVARCLAPY